MTKQPSLSGERPNAEAPDSDEQPFDPSHFGKHEFPVGLREELIRAEKPRIDPKFLQDTVPPNRKPVLTEPEHPITTPRGGFAAPKTASAVDRNAPTLIAAPTMPKASPNPAAVVADSPSAPPVDTSRDAPTLVLPRVRQRNNKRSLVIGVVVALLALLVVGLLMRTPVEVAAPSTTPPPKPATPTQTTQASKPEQQTLAIPAPALPVAPARSSATPSAATTDAARPGKEPKHPSRAVPNVSSKAVTPAAQPSSAPAPRGKQPWIDGL